MQANTVWMSGFQCFTRKLFLRRAEVNELVDFTVSASPTSIWIANKDGKTGKTLFFLLLNLRSLNDNALIIRTIQRDLPKSKTPPKPTQEYEKKIHKGFLNNTLRTPSHKQRPHLLRPQPFRQRDVIEANCRRRKVLCTCIFLPWLPSRRCTIQGDMLRFAEGDAPICRGRVRLNCGQEMGTMLARSLNGQNSWRSAAECGGAQLCYSGFCGRDARYSQRTFTRLYANASGGVRASVERIEYR